MTRNERRMAIYYFAKIKERQLKILYFIIYYRDSISVKIYLSPHDPSMHICRSDSVWRGQHAIQPNLKIKTV